MNRNLRLMAGRSAGYITHTVLPLHLPTVCDLHFQPCSRNVIHVSRCPFTQSLSATCQLTLTPLQPKHQILGKSLFKVIEKSWLRAKKLYSHFETHFFCMRHHAENKKPKLKTPVYQSREHCLCCYHQFYAVTLGSVVFESYIKKQPRMCRPLLSVISEESDTA